MIRRLIQLAAVLLIIRASWYVFPPFWRYLEFKDSVQQMARYEGRRKDDELQQRVLDAAGALQVPLAPGAVGIRRHQGYVYIAVHYTESLEVLPRYRYPWEIRFESSGLGTAVGAGNESPSR